MSKQLKTVRASLSGDDIAYAVVTGIGNLWSVYVNRATAQEAADSWAGLGAYVQEVRIVPVKPKAKRRAKREAGR